MNNIRKLTLAGEGIAAVGFGYGSLDRLLLAANTKAIVLQKKLADAPELTEKSYLAAKEIAEGMASSAYDGGLFYAVCAAVMATSTVIDYYKFKKE